jgi:(2Fe-2S) ferredoxin
MSSGFYKQHLFFCTNQREEGAERPCCANGGSKQLLQYAKKQVQARDMNGPGKVRVSSAGCLGRCEQGPAVVVYPEGIWYTCMDESDVDAIIETHLQNGQHVERLLID